MLFYVCNIGNPVRCIIIRIGAMQNVINFRFDEPIYDPGLKR